MDKKKALIVDDSKLARFVLKEMLHEYGMEVVTMESAEEALGYLCTQKPDVIFMDHSMPGMDGFKAVEAIKQDPQTTSIPIMMYTSREGSMYVSQARALGAIGVLPKQLKSVQLRKILQELDLIPVTKSITSTSSDTQKSDTTAFTTDDTSITVDGVAITVPEAVNASLKQLPPQQEMDALEDLAYNAKYAVQANMFQPIFQGLLDEQRKLFRQDMRKVATAITRKLMGGSTEIVAGGTVIAVPRSLANILAIIFVISVPFIWLIFQYNTLGEKLDKLQLDSQRAQMHSLATQSLLSERSVDADKRLLEVQVQREKDHHIFLKTVAWALNSRNTVPFDESLLGDKAMKILSTLIPALVETNFRGAIIVKAHSAEFCVEHRNGEQRMHAKNKPFAACKMLHQESSETIEFTNYLATLKAGINETIQIRIENIGFTSPLVPYPPHNTVKTAEEWNLIAEANKRIEIDFEHK